MLTNVYIQKSFWMIGQSSKVCFDCDYCRLAHDKVTPIYATVPTSINKVFINFPVAVNLFYGDPTLQVESTVRYVKILEEAGHKGPVVIITKGSIDRLVDTLGKIDLDLHFAFSVVGKKGLIEWTDLARVVRNYEYATSIGAKSSVELRPIINGVNDGEELNQVVRLCADLKLAIGYSGLQAPEQLRDIWNGQRFKPYEGKQFGWKKEISDEVETRIRSIAKFYEVPVFSKTACLISYVHNLGRDYNAHYYRPNEVGCKECTYKAVCHSNRPTTVDLELPFPYQVITKEKHTCHHAKLGICKSVTDDCYRISGSLIDTDVKLTISDIRIIKWLTGLTVNARFDDFRYISSFWKESNG